MQVKAILSLGSIISKGQNGHNYKVYKKKKKKGWRGCVPSTLLVGMSIGATTKENRMEAP